MDFDFFESGTGDGPALLFIPGSYSAHTAWRAVQASLTGSYRMITTSLPGYGGTPEIRDDRIDDLSAVTDFIAEVVARVGEPVHMIGHSYGGMNIYASVLTGAVSPESIVTFEGNPIYSRHADTPYPWVQETMEMKDGFEAAVLAGDPDAAGLIIDYWGAPGMFKSMPEPFAEFCRSKTFTNLLDWRQAFLFRPYFSEFARLDKPCTVARGALANQAIIDVSDEIVANAKNAVLHVEPGAGHFLISTHPAECAALIDQHMAQFVEV
ncbi:MAG: alpha/beta fold hydrolase [Pikeienuella sp.]